MFTNGIKGKPQFWLVEAKKKRKSPFSKRCNYSVAGALFWSNNPTPTATTATKKLIADRPSTLISNGHFALLNFIYILFNKRVLTLNFLRHINKRNVMDFFVQSKFFFVTYHVFASYVYTKLLARASSFISFI